MKIFFATLFTFIFSICLAQKGNPTIYNALIEYDFIQEQIISDNDTIIYYLKNPKAKPNKLVVFIQGTDANPIFSYKIDKDKITYYRWFGDDYKKLDSTYTYAIIPKPGMEGLYKDGEIVIPKSYYKKNYLEYRIKQINTSISHITENHLTNPEKIIVYGHSEGAAIGAALATTNKKITHLGFWSGNVLNNFYEFSLFNRIESLKGKLSDKEAHQNIMGILEWYTSVVENPNLTEIDHFGFTNKRWSTYEKAPLDYLIELSIPIYALFGTEDESTPIETAYLLPIKFIENRKDNLTFEVCISCNHSYKVKTEDGQKSYWSEQFIKFIEWTDKTK
ncbi:hypothetical protein GGR42_000502 [Saonia flava]|uniref:Uncharacterized protein n=1 Tax=Saonia flava TaxID=523696 RepID=A0A846QSV6_9FLAO|nr:hypothetical protein [Saonia flava]NJB70040.1 hypothetical protein [Saonia flava]